MRSDLKPTFSDLDGLVHRYRAGNGSQFSAASGSGTVVAGLLLGYARDTLYSPHFRFDLWPNFSSIR